MSTVPTTLESLIAEVLAVDETGLTDASGRGTVTEWDSVGHLNVLSAVEETFDVVFSSAEMRELTSIGAIRMALRSKESDG
jgi:acyl carrier protein